MSETTLSVTPPSDAGGLTHFVIFDPATGRIAQTGACPSGDFAVQRAAPGLAILAGRGHDGLDHVAPDPTAPGGLAIRPRPALSAFDRATIRADGADAARLAGLPADARVTIDGAGHAVPDTGPDAGVLVVTATTAGPVIIAIDPPWPWLPWRGAIIAT